MSKSDLHIALFAILLIVGAIVILQMILNGEWEQAATAVSGVIGTILTLDITKDKESES